jgi:hypothetical protein
MKTEKVWMRDPWVMRAKNFPFFFLKKKKKPFEREIRLESDDMQKGS